MGFPSDNDVSEQTEFDRDRLDLSSPVASGRLPIFRLVVLFFVLLVAATAVLIGIKKMLGSEQTFTFEKIKVEGHQILSANEVLLLSGLASSSVVSTTQLREAAGNIKEHPAIVDLEFAHSDDELIIRIQERQCFAIVRSHAGVQMYDVDYDLHVISSDGGLRCGGSPVITTALSPDNGVFVSPALLALAGAWLQLKKDYPELASRISEVRLEPGGEMIFYVTGNRIKIILPAISGENFWQRINASLAYLDSSKITTGVLDLKGRDGLFIP